MPDCDKCDEWFANSAQLSAHKKDKHPKIKSPPNRRLSLDSATTSQKTSQKKKRSSKGGSATSTPVMPRMLHVCKVCGDKSMSAYELDFHHYLTNHGGGYYSGQSQEEARKLYVDWYGNKPKYVSPVRNRPRTSNVKAHPVGPASSLLSAPVSRNVTEEHADKSASTSSVQDVVSKNSDDKEDNSVTPSSSRRVTRRSAAAADKDASDATEVDSVSSSKRRRGGAGSDSGLSSSSGSSSNAKNTLSLDEFIVSPLRPSWPYPYCAELEAVVDEYAARNGTVFASEEERDELRKDARNMKWVETKRILKEKEEQYQREKQEAEEKKIRLEKERKEACYARMRIRLGDEAVDKYLRDIEEEKKKEEEIRNMCEEDRQKIYEERAKEWEKKEAIRRKELEEDEKIRKQEEKRKLAQKRREEEAAAKARALNPDVKPINWLDYDIEASKKEEDARIGAARKKSPDTKTELESMAEISRELYVTVFNSSIECVGYANVFSSEETFDVQDKMEEYRREMLKDDRFIKCWQSLETRRERIERSLKKAFTQAMNDRYAERKTVWDERLKNNPNRNLNYKRMERARGHLIIAMAPDAKTVIYGTQKREADAIAELVQEEWSEEHGRSTKSSFAKIVSPEQPEYYISKYLLEKMSEDNEWKTWEKLERKTGEMTVHLPVVIPNDEMDSYVFHRMCWRELIDTNARGYQLWLNEPLMSAATWGTIKEAIEERVKQ